MIAVAERDGFVELDLLAGRVALRSVDGGSDPLAAGDSDA
jgi:hypothetical protein